MKVYSTEEVAKKLNIHTTTVLKLINEGELPAKKVARKWRVTENQLRKYLEESKPDLASELLNIIDEETKELFGKDKAKELREQVNQRLKDKGLEEVQWD